jgi:hypothetical protein
LLGSDNPTGFRFTEDQWRAIRPHLPPRARAHPDGARRTLEAIGSRYRVGWYPSDPVKRAKAWRRVETLSARLRTAIEEARQAQDYLEWLTLALAVLRVEATRNADAYDEIAAASRGGRRPDREVLYRYVVAEWVGNGGQLKYSRSAKGPPIGSAISYLTAVLSAICGERVSPETVVSLMEREHARREAGPYRVEYDRK